jgi:peptidoglycan hydrolase-like protein with peptidoglycan-binding domain
MKHRCRPIGLATRQNGEVRTLMRVTAVVALTLAGNSLAISSARAEIPELGDCRADAELRVGSTGGSVICVQWALLWMGYYKGLVNGAYDQATANAVINFQLDHPPLTVNGNATAQTLIAMNNYSGVDNAAPPACLADAPVTPGDRGPSTECVQQVLAGQGLFAGKVDGSYGKDTQEAVKAFQFSNPPLKANGVADSSTLAALGVWSGFTNEGGGIPIDTNWWPSPFQAEPNFRVVQGIPVFGNHHYCSKADADTIALEFAKDGADVSTQQYFIYIASREGGCNYQAVNINPATQDDSHCSFQLNALAGMFEPNAELGRRGWTKENVKESMKNCADAASDLWVFCARGPWTPPYSCTPPWAGDLGPEGDV